MKETLLSEHTKKKSQMEVFPLMPDVVALQIGGKIIDSGAEAIIPLLEEIKQCVKRNKMIIATGSGKRARHVMSVAIDLGLPVGLVAELRRLDSELNAHIIGALLSPVGIPELTHAEMVHMLPAMLEMSRAVVFNGVPPYDIWEHPPTFGKDPPTGADAGVYLFASTCGMKRIVYVRDVDGIYDDDPKLNKSANLVKRGTPDDLLELKNSCIDREVFELMKRARNPADIVVVNGLKKGRVISSLTEHVTGTVISRA